VIEAYREARRKAGKEGDGEIVFQALWSWAETDEAAFEAARKWKGAQPEDHYTRDWHKPREMYEHGEQEMSDEEFAQNAIVGSDPHEHVERLRELEQLGATVIVLQNNSGADPLRAIEVYGEQVLPELRGARV
jgi:coenzyme F420-dependent glucose-6-phosphate dehydrogenase